MPISPKENYDVAIIGAGVSGLTSAALFRKAGLSVCVLEMNPIPGGYLQGFNRKDFRFDSAIHWLNNCGPGGLVTRTFQIIGNDFPKAQEQKHIRRFLSKEHNYLVTNNPEELREQWIIDFPHEKKGINRFFNDAKKLAKVFESHTFLSRTGASMDWHEKVAHAFRMTKFVLPFLPFIRFAGEKGVEKGLRRYFKDERLRRVFCAEPDLLSCIIPISWAYSNDFQTPPEGGSQTFGEWLEHVVGEMKGDLFFRTKVNSVLLENDTAVGVIAEHRGQEYKINSKYVIAACDAETMYTKMLPKSTLADKWKEKLRSAELYASAFTVALGLDCPAEDLGMGEENVFLSDPKLPRKKLGDGDPHTCGIHVLASTVRDKSLSLPEHGTITLFIPAFIEQYDFWKTERDENGKFIRGEAYKKLKLELADIVIDRVQNEMIPNLRDHIVYLDVATPITHQRYTGNKAGSMMGQRPGKENTKGKVASYKTPYKNLYLSGHWADLGGGIPIAVKSSINTTFMVLKNENRPVFNLLVKYMRGKLTAKELEQSQLLTPYANNWKLKPTPAQKILARKKREE